MPAKRPLPFGLWPSPVSAERAARGSRRFGMVQAGQEGSIWWTEARPQEQGRQVIVRVGADGRPEDVLPKPYSARSRVHEYGGGEFLVSDATVYFVNDKDQQVYALSPPQAPRRLTRAPGTRFADLAHDASRGRLIAVAEVHPAKGSRGAKAVPRNALVAIALGGQRGQVTEMAGAHDFYASPRLSGDGEHLAFLAWDLPDMPWDSATLYVAELHEDGALGRPKRVAGGNGSAVFQPEWGPDGHLYFTWDKTGWGHLYRWAGGKIMRVHGAAGAELWRPQWVFGARCFALSPDGRFAAVAWKRGAPVVEIGKLVGGRAAAYPALPGRAARIDDPLAVGSGFAALVSSPVAMPAVMTIGPGGAPAIAEHPHDLIEPGCISRGDVLAFKNTRRQTVFAVHYPPTNPQHRGPKGAVPPALVLAHGGPTSMTDASFKPRVQFYTSRGFAVLDVNYAGSTGYGRAYRARLDGQWGIADVADCAAAARHLAQAGLADPSRIAIAGGSAGGYTALMALATTQTFAAGSSHYGISDLGLLLAHTHKFEQGYLHRLLGTTPSQWKDVFAARSPINLIDGITAPVILFQGLDDKVVPPEQSRRIVSKLKRRGIEVDYREFAGEGHGFRKAETIIAVLEAELAFLCTALRLG
ncbi:MAG: prolyl oligopeptidase family serine peptidase [Hyphomonadaceae bacterium]|nr:prolyl oligopeptidase family serine peptidase [Hyphomonadaceae bacterium]